MDPGMGTPRSPTRVVVAPGRAAGGNRAPLDCSGSTTLAC